MWLVLIADYDKYRFHALSVCDNDNVPILLSQCWFLTDPHNGIQHSIVFYNSITIFSIVSLFQLNINTLLFGMIVNQLLKWSGGCCWSVERPVFYFQCSDLNKESQTICRESPFWEILINIWCVVAARWVFEWMTNNVNISMSARIFSR